MMDILISQLTDPFRIGLILALLFTALRTRAETGMLIPLGAGVLFVAVMLPSTMGLPDGADLKTAVGIGAVANAILLGVALLGWAAYQRFGAKR
ncbi:MAG: hypothetical protein RLZZ563_1171 [Pseudomonadota bacterium]|jgi:hypothetical protein